MPFSLDFLLTYLCYIYFGFGYPYITKIPNVFVRIHAIVVYDGLLNAYTVSIQTVELIIFVSASWSQGRVAGQEVKVRQTYRVSHTTSRRIWSVSPSTRTSYIY